MDQSSQNCLNLVVVMTLLVLISTFFPACSNPSFDLGQSMYGQDFWDRKGKQAGG